MGEEGLGEMWGRRDQKRSGGEIYILCIVNVLLNLIDGCWPRNCIGIK